MVIDISVVVPIYNCEKYLSQCIESIIHQTYRALEIILVDDGSTDASGEIADQYARKDPRIKVIHKKNGGLVSARKAGVLHAQGKYIAYIDSDDYVDNDTYEKMYHWVHTNNADVVICGFTRESAEGEQFKQMNAIESGVYTKESLEVFFQRMINFGSYYTPGIFPSLCLKLFRKELLLENQLSVPEDLTMGEDSAGTFPALLESNCIVVDNDICGYHYCERAGSMTQSFNRNYFLNLSMLYEYLKSRYQDYDGRNLQKQLEMYRLYMLHMGADKVRRCEDMSPPEKIKYLDQTVKQTSIFRDIDKVDMMGFPEMEGKRLLWIYQGNWFMLRTSYAIEDWKQKLYTLLVKCIPMLNK